MRTTAELTGEGGVPFADRNDTDDIAVLLSEQCDSTGGLGLLEIHLTRDNGIASEDLVIDDVLNSLKLVGAQSLKVRKVETQVLRSNEGTRLLHMISQNLLEGGIEQMGRRMVATKQGAAVRVDGSANGIADMQLALGNGRNMRIQTVVALGVANAHGSSRGNKLASIALLTAHLSIEWRDIENDIDRGTRSGRFDGAPIVHDSENHGTLDLVTVVSIELRGGNLIGELDPHVVEGTPGIALCSGARAVLLSGHAGVETIHIDSMACSLGDLDGKIDGETKRIVQFEGDLAGERLILVERIDGLIEIRAAVIERRGEALLLGGNDALDKGNVLEQLRIRVAHDAVDFVDECVEEGPLDTE